jgi:RNA polymerase sigma-70 factor (ECF subfamily)
MERIKYGSDADAAFAELVSEWQGRLIHFARRATGDISVAEDIAQETFLRVWRCRHSYNERGSFDSWLWRIARNLIVNRHRGQRCDVLHGSERDSEDYSVTASLADEPDNPLETLLYREQVASVMTAMDRLSGTSDDIAEQMLTLLALCDGDARSLSEASGVSIPTIKSRKRLAVEKLEMVVMS